MNTSTTQIKKKVPKDTFEKLRSKQKRIMAEMETSSNKGDMGNIIAACDKLVDEIESINKYTETHQRRAKLTTQRIQFHSKSFKLSI